MFFNQVMELNVKKIKKNKDSITHYNCLKENTLNQLKIDLAELEKTLHDSGSEKRKQEQEFLKENIEKGVQELVLIGGQINTLAIEIQALMFKFKEIAVKVNGNYHLIQQPPNLRLTKRDKSKLGSWRPLNIWDVHSSTIPTVVRRGAKFILTVKMVDLFNAERARDADRWIETASKEQ